LQSTYHPLVPQINRLILTLGDFEAMPRLRILCRDSPQRTIALTTSEYALVFQHSLTSHAASPTYTCSKAPRCLVEFSSLSRIDTNSYRLLGYGYGTLGLITVDEDVFVCVVTGSSQAATVRPGETISRISNVDFCTLCRITHRAFLTICSLPYPSSL